MARRNAGSGRGAGGGSADVAVATAAVVVDAAGMGCRWVVVDVGGRKSPEKTCARGFPVAAAAAAAAAAALPCLRCCSIMLTTLNASPVGEVEAMRDGGGGGDEDDGGGV